MKAEVYLKENKREVSVNLPASKSISNRLLIIRELCEEKFLIDNLSASDDTQLLLEILESNNAIEYCGHGGTTLRFLLALRAVQGKEVVITGSERLKERPINILVKTLNNLGANITYAERKNFAPVKVSKGNLQGGSIDIDASISSQFISALMMIAPALENGLRINLKGKIVSSSYIKLTASLMNVFGIDVEFSENTITIPSSKYEAQNISCTSDWSAAAFWYGIVACTDNLIIRLTDLAKDEFQADRILMEWMKFFDVNSNIDGNDIVIRKEKLPLENKSLTLNFINHPDLLQMFAVVAAIKGVEVNFTGLSTLKIKETDRLSALKTELEKTGVEVFINDDSIQIKGKADPLKIESHIFNTYNDHRMAMCLSILSTQAKIIIDDPLVVNKSFPGYFDQLKQAGFEVNFY